MSTVDDINAAIERLSAGEVARVRAWLAEYAERLWDEQIDRDERSGRLDSLIDRADERSGRLDSLIDRALEEHRAGRTRPL